MLHNCAPNHLIVLGTIKLCSENFTLHCPLLSGERRQRPPPWASGWMEGAGRWLSPDGGGEVLDPVVAHPGRMQEHTPPTPGRDKDIQSFQLELTAKEPLLPRFLLKLEAPPSSQNRPWELLHTPGTPVLQPSLLSGSLSSQEQSVWVGQYGGYCSHGRLFPQTLRPLPTTT